VQPELGVVFDVKQDRLAGFEGRLDRAAGKLSRSDAGCDTASPALTNGSVSVKRAPLRFWLLAVTCPLWSSAMRLTSASPMPLLTERRAGEAPPRRKRSNT
jgi:hypothetical protein